MAFGITALLGLYTFKEAHSLCAAGAPLENTAQTQKEQEAFYKLLPANKADHLCQLWQSFSDLHKIQTVCDIVENPHSIRLSKK